MFSLFRPQTINAQDVIAEHTKREDREGFKGIPDWPDENLGFVKEWHKGTVRLVEPNEYRA